MNSNAKRNMDELGIPSDKCAYCDTHLNKITATLEHIIATSQGGAATDYRNRIWACGSCNNILKKDALYGRPQSLNQRLFPIHEGGYIVYVIEDIEDRKNYVHGIRGWLKKVRTHIDPPN